jgi:uncharacterized protein (TIGR02996 family)
MRTFEYSDAKSHKFWNIELKGKSFTVTYGRIGAAGQAQVKDFADEARAKKEHDKLIAEKTGKGYRETTPSAVPAPASLREALEQALVVSPDDLSSHMAYADYLEEQGDPLGEFIRVQLALEDTSKSPAERKKLQAREKKLLGQHRSAWLGELAPFLLPRKSEKESADENAVCKFSLARGWLDSLEVKGFNVAFMRVLARAPQTRLLRRLVLADENWEFEGEYEPGPDIPEDADPPALYPLARSPYLGNVRILQVGETLSRADEDGAAEGSHNCLTDGCAAVGLVKLMPRLEELYLLCHSVDADQLFALKTIPKLRILQLYHSDSYPLAKLARNPSLTRLTHLLLHPHALEEEPYIRLPGVKALVNATNLPSLTHLRLRLSDMGDKGVEEIVASGILRRLKVLDPRHGCITDKGAELFAACPDAKHLELLDLRHNCMTRAGANALKSSGANCDTQRQWKPGEPGEFDDSGDNEYLFAGDIE